MGAYGESLRQPHLERQCRYFCGIVHRNLYFLCLSGLNLEVGNLHGVAIEGIRRHACENGERGEEKGFQKCLFHNFSDRKGKTGQPPNPAFGL